MEDKLILGGKEFKSRFILGSGKYNLNLIKAAVEQGGAGAPDVKVACGGRCESCSDVTHDG